MRPNKNIDEPGTTPRPSMDLALLYVVVGVVLPFLIVLALVKSLIGIARIKLIHFAFYIIRLKGGTDEF